MAEILLRVDELNEIPVDQIEEYKEKAYTLSQEISDKQTLLDRMQQEVAKSKDSEKGEEFSVQFNAISRQHSSALSLLVEKKQVILASDWSKQASDWSLIICRPCPGGSPSWHGIPSPWLT